MWHHRPFAVIVLFSTLFLTLMLGLNTAAAQDQVVVRLDIPNTALQTGQFYDVAIRIENAPQFWALDLTLEYDPDVIYVVGTKSGSPVAAGELFGGVSSIVVQNRVEAGQIRYMVSKVGETAPAEGSGVIGTLRIYPLMAGETRLQFPRLQAVALSSYDPNATNVTTSDINVVPARLELTVTGNPAEPLSEATATPLPTETPQQGIALPTLAVPTEQPTLENIVFATSTPTALTMQEVPTAPDNSGIALVAALLIAVGVVGLGGLLLVRGRGRK